MKPLAPSLRPLAWIVLMLMLALAQQGCKDQQQIPGDPWAAINTIEGHRIQPLQQTAAAKVFIFVSHDCPIANAYAPQINAIIRDYAPRDVKFFIVHADVDVPPDQARQHAREYGFACNVLLDREHHLVKFTGATVTPEAAVLDATNRVRYLGRIDDRYVDFGKRRAAPSQHDLRNAIDAVLGDRRVAVERTRAVGCYISGAMR